MKLDQETRALLEQALAALENGKRVRNCEGGTQYQPPIEDAAIAAIRNALANNALDKMAENERELGIQMQQDHIRDATKMVDPKPADEPVAWQWLNTANFRKTKPKYAECGSWNPLYTRPQPAATAMFGGGLVAIRTLLSRDPCAHATVAIEMIDAMLREKNGGKND